jgi:DNA-binding transcriptional MocR family regulator
VNGQNGHPHVPADEVAASLGEGWVEGPGPLYQKLARSLQGAIDDGHLPGGTYMPYERMLARALFICRNTVVAAYLLLREQRALASRRGHARVDESYCSTIRATVARCLAHFMSASTTPQLRRSRSSAVAA